MIKRLGAFTVLLAFGWWVMRMPSNERAWQADVAQVGWAEVDGDRVRVHNVRNFAWGKTEAEFNARWVDREVKISDIRGIDLIVSHWGSPWIAHALVSFDFGENLHRVVAAFLFEENLHE